jgi:hypothetical protein
MVTVDGPPPRGSFAAGTAISRWLAVSIAVSIIDIAPTLSPTVTDDKILPEVRLNEINDPPVTDATNPTFPLAAIRGCACSSSTAEEGSERLRT